MRENKNRTRSDDAPAVRIDADNESAWCGALRLSLTPRAFAVLRHLVEHRGRLITKQQLLTAVWRDAIVSDAALSSCIRDVRRALGDSSGAPRYLQTVHRRGFRFVGPVASASVIPASCAASTLVGRDVELARLHEHLDRALSGRRQLVFVTGEPGIGKTALVETFLSHIGDADALRIGCGQCVEQYGAGEAYLPVLEALGRLGRATGSERLVGILTQHAPTWLEQLPGLLKDSDVETVRRRAHGATRNRMLRELVEALDALTLDAPLVLLLEDLHWSDSASIELLGMLARRREVSRLLVLATYRPADVASAAHPLPRIKHELQLHGHCDEIRLAFLSEAAVDEYLARRFPGHGLPSGLASVLHRNTEGNPLFLIDTIDDLIDQSQLREVDGQWRLLGPAEDLASWVPKTLWQLVDKQIELLKSDEQAILEAASVAGAEFSAAAVGAAGIEASQTELRCEALARRGQFLRAVGSAEWPDGTVAGRYAFIHALYRQVLYERVAIGTRVALHLRTAERLERGYGERAREVASELALHFEHGRDFERAAQYRRQAAEHALHQHAYREAGVHATIGLESLGLLARSRERAQRELSLQVTLGAALTATQGYGAPDVARPTWRGRTGARGSCAPRPEIRWSCYPCCAASDDSMSFVGSSRRPATWGAISWPSRKPGETPRCSSWRTTRWASRASTPATSKPPSSISSVGSSGTIRSGIARRGRPCSASFLPVSRARSTPPGRCGCSAIPSVRPPAVRRRWRWHAPSMIPSASRMRVTSPPRCTTGDESMTSCGRSKTRLSSTTPSTASGFSSRPG